MDNLTTERTPLVIAAEINMITCQTKKIVLASAIEIGRHLQEAKAMLKHGEWIKWLEESVNYSRRTASRLIKIYEEYGPSFPEGSDNSNGTPVSHLTYTQALLLLGLPEEEREEFIAHNDVGSMTKQGLQQALKDRDQANQAKEQALQEKDQALQENQALKKGLETIDSTISELKNEQAKAASRPTNPENVNAEAQSANNTSSAGNDPSATTAPFTHNLKTEHDPDAHIKYVEKCDTCCKTIADTFFDLTTALTNLAHRSEPERRKKKRGQPAD
ncbi:Protein export cytoplasm protein SecA ATPase RNA helicase [Dehalobacter sp. UNSWDHB]|nr:Protein export cytoplasm protein SecA ATPase RNA helicase [Dehalobacter sp. UNSWDHB]